MSLNEELQTSAAGFAHDVREELQAAPGRSQTSETDFAHDVREELQAAPAVFIFTKNNAQTSVSSTSCGAQGHEDEGLSARHRAKTKTKSSITESSYTSPSFAHGDINTRAEVKKDERRLIIVKLAQWIGQCTDVPGYILLFFCLQLFNVLPIDILQTVVARWLIVFWLGQSLKDVAEMPRPSSFTAAGSSHKYASEFGMPSTHALSATIVFFQLFVFLLGDTAPEAAILLPTGISFIVGASRIIQGVHHLEDVVVGWALGFFGLFANVSSINHVPVYLPYILYLLIPRWQQNTRTSWDTSLAIGGLQGVVLSSSASLFPSPSILVPIITFHIGVTIAFYEEKDNGSALDKDAGTRVSALDKDAATIVACAYKLPHWYAKLLYEHIVYFCGAVVGYVIFLF